LERCIVLVSVSGEFRSSDTHKQQTVAFPAVLVAFSPLCELHPPLRRNKHSRYITLFIPDHSSRKLGIGCSGGMDGEMVKVCCFPRVNTSDM
jgi:hypothetical protein